jgi:hypothetical protein
MPRLTLCASAIIELPGGLGSIMVGFVKGYQIVDIGKLSTVYEAALEFLKTDPL